MGPIQKLYHSIREFLFPGHYKIQSFTFYVPSPPTRKVGYREKEFDKIFYSFINRGFQIIDIKTQSNANSTQSGMWIIIIAKSLRKSSAALNFEDAELSEHSLEPIPEMDQEVIDGLYHIND
ncbi:hypothetical protein BIY24_08780 [Halobacteriovorax marinus]|uniref:Uncharacterized protein n=1 Tax=Halobacteriovorax marinus (strain ATCC BAA-682 / DSM 15412 / SJ) TaxID=862908 RepID=E1X233_HALMS|nr:hypothetical protein [Halobacteriovorax marinus]ATH08042.1 hypothetical protein BIY24_08780 [Halobacteriovorax marinus]CBW26693.1 hypothetical protein BMS_1873 [Halobacteriovorax marinus SJ]